MGKISIFDDCLVPDRYTYLSYSGKNPWGLANKIIGSIRPFFHVSASGYNNTRVNWDVSTDPIAFYSIWWVRRVFSRWSTMIIHIKIQGKKSKTVNEGEFTMQLNSELRTEFGGWSILLKPLWLLYSYFFYNKARRRYLQSCRNITLAFKNEIKEHFKLETTKVPSAYGTYG